MPSYATRPGTREASEKQILSIPRPFAVVLGVDVAMALVVFYHVARRHICIDSPQTPVALHEKNVPLGRRIFCMTWSCAGCVFPMCSDQSSRMAFFIVRLKCARLAR